MLFKEFVSKLKLEKISRCYAIQYMSNNKKQFGLIGKFYKIANAKTIFILVHKLIRSHNFFENNLENNLFYKEQFNYFFFKTK